MVSALYFGTDLTLTLPTGATTPYMLFSSRKLSSYAGAFGRVVRASDSTTQDVAFRVDGVPDAAAADTFGTATTIKIDKWYDQSGNGRDLVQATDASRPEFDIRNEFRGLRPVSFCGEALTGKVKFLQSEDTLALSKTGITVYMLVAPRCSYNGYGLFDFTSLDFLTSGLRMATIAGSNGTLLQVDGNISVQATTPLSQPTLISWSAGASQIKRVGGVETTTASAFSSSVLASLMVGKQAGITQGAAFDLLFFAAYAAAHSSATMQLMEAELARCFSPVTGQTKRVVYNGSSLIGGFGLVANQYPTWIAGYGQPQEPTWEVFNLSSVATVQGEYGLRASFVSFYDATKTRNVYVTDAASNDISNASAFANQAAAETFADTTYSTYTLPLVAYHKTTGYALVVPTIIARSDHTTANFREYARLRYNANVRSGAAANGYRASDRAATLSNFSDTTYFQGDGTHLTTAGSAALAAIDKTEILAA